jgi:adenylate cyclase
MRKKILHGVLCGLGGALVAAALWLGGALERLESTTWAWRVQAMAKPGAATDRIRIILLDQSSLDWGKKEMALPWPWPREVYGPIIDYCRRGGAKAIALDVLFTEPSVHGVADDEALGGVIGGGRDVAAAVFLSNTNGDASAWPADLAVPAPPAGFATWLAGARLRKLDASLASFPIPEIATNAALLGNVSDVPDRDGVFRRASLLRLFGEAPVYSLGLAALMTDRQAARAAIAPGALSVGRYTAPIDDAGRAILRFRGPSQTHRTFSAAAVFQSEMRLREKEGEPPIKDPAVFKDCYVFFGFSAPGLMDLRAVSASDKPYPGVEVHATALDNMLSGDFLRDAPVARVMLLTLALALLAGVAMALSRKPWHSVVAFLVVPPIPVLAGFVAYAQGYWLPVVVQVVAVLGGLVSAVIVNYATEGRQKAFIKQAFRHYLSPQVIDKIIADPSQLKLGGERRELTIFFSDLQGFSALSEKLDPQALTGLLNDYLTDMTDIILEEGGTLDKYEGDAIIAFWNAPLGLPDHALRACRAAIRCQCKLDERREEFRRRSGVDLRMRIGINTGDVVVGNMGSRDRFDYTVLGDAANLASRLEGANKAFGTYLMVSESTWAQTNSAFVGRELARLRVVGRAAPVRVFNFTGLAGEAAPAEFAEFARGLDLWYRGNLHEAMAIFERNTGDAASQRYAERCRKYVAETGGEWDGVWNLTEK